MDTVVGKQSGTVFDLHTRALIGQGREGRVFRAGDRCVKVFFKPLTPEEAWAVETVVRRGRTVPGFA